MNKTKAEVTMKITIPFILDCILMLKIEDSIGTVCVHYTWCGGY